MVLRAFAAANLTLRGGSAFMNNFRPLESTVLAICARAPGAPDTAHKANAPR